MRYPAADTRIGDWLLLAAMLCLAALLAIGLGWIIFHAVRGG